MRRWLMFRDAQYRKDKYAKNDVDFVLIVWHKSTKMCPCTRRHTLQFIISIDPTSTLTFLFSDIDPEARKTIF